MTVKHLWMKPDKHWTFNKIAFVLLTGMQVCLLLLKLYLTLVYQEPFLDMTLFSSVTIYLCVIPALMTRSHDKK